MFSNVVNMVKSVLDTGAPDRGVTLADRERDNARGAGERNDGWTNVTTGLGTGRDKTQGGFFQAGRFLTDQNIADLYTYDDIAARIVDTYPREEMRLGFGYKGIKPLSKKKFDRYLKRFKLVEHVTRARTWGRCFGGCVTWIMVDDGLDPIEPLDKDRVRSVLGLRTIDRRWVIPETFYPDGPNVGEPMVYRIQEPHTGGIGSTIGMVHASRLVRWPGDTTEQLEQNRRRGWDMSVLVRPYDALKASGETWAAINLLVTEANQNVYKVSHLYEKIAGDAAMGDGTPGDPTGGGTFLKRVQIMDRVKSVFRAIVLDKEEEEFERHTMTWAGLADLSNGAWMRVSAAAKIPVMILTGQSPAGLSATGNTTIQWFYNEAQANREQIDEPRILDIMCVLLSAKDAPAFELVEDKKARAADDDREDADTDGADGEDKFDALELVWLPLWAPTAAELADIRVKRMQETTGYVTAQVLLPEEALLSLPEDWFPDVDREMREASLEADAEALLAKNNETKLAPPPPVVVPGNPNGPPPPAGKKPPPFTKGKP